MNKEHK